MNRTSLTLSFLLLFAGGVAAEELKLTCSSFYTDERIEAENKMLRAGAEKHQQDMVGRALMSAFKQFSEQCIELGFPAEQHIYIIDKNDLKKYGKYQATATNADCKMQGAQFNVDTFGERLVPMTVTSDSLLLGKKHEQPLLLIRSSLKANKKTFFSDKEYGPFDYSCSLEELKIKKKL